MFYCMFYFTCDRSLKGRCRDLFVSAATDTDTRQLPCAVYVVPGRRQCVVTAQVSLIATGCRLVRLQLIPASLLDSR